MLLKDYHPQSKLVTPQTLVSRPRYPVIDAHNHLGDFGGSWEKRPVGEMLAALDAVDVRVYVDLDGGWGENILEKHLDTMKAGAPERFVMFGGVDWSQWPAHGNRFGEWAADRLRAQARRGAQGLKIWKPLGLSVRDDQEVLVGVDDARLDPIWQTAGELNLPVLIHVADPVAFFDPIDATNERWEELGGNPDWAFTSPPGPSFLSIVEGLANVVARHPATTFIGAHVGCYAENLSWVSALLDRCPNFFVDISARIGELGRQPYTARRFFLRHSERILFGLDAGVNHDYYRVTFRFLESEDEYFPYGPGLIPGQGRWNIYGLNLPDEVLRQVYHANAMKVLGLKVLP
jgi:predicted TIM-barrel fold metal-dependent hydrolase